MPREEPRPSRPNTLDRPGASPWKSAQPKKKSEPFLTAVLWVSSRQAFCGLFLRPWVTAVILAIFAFMGHATITREASELGKNHKGGCLT